MVIRPTLFILAAGAVLTLLSSTITGRAHAVYSEIMGCESGCDAAAAGWPVPYLVDYPGISVAGSAGLFGALVGEDRFRPLAFCFTLSFWVALTAAALFLWRRLARSGRSTGRKR